MAPTDQLPFAGVHARSGDEWADLTSRTFLPVAVQNVDDDFQATLRRFSLSADVSLTELVADGCLIHRSPRLIRTDPADDLLFCLQVAGRGSVRQADRVADLAPGDAVLYDPSQPYALDYRERSHKLIIQADRRSVLGRGLSRLNGEVPSAIAVPAAQPTLRALRAVASEVTQLDLVGAGDEAASVGQVITQLLSATLDRVSGDQPEPLGRVALLKMLQVDIESRLDDPDLSPPSLAERHHLSLRYVHKLFEDTQTTAAAYIREQRLLRAYRLLSTGNAPSITNTAFRCGFDDSTTFSRTFRRRFGRTPSEVRRLAVDVTGEESPLDRS